jgi:enoyl-[acyl-carrier protein] reductase I
MGMFEGKKVLVLGAASDRSVAWGISQSFHQAGSELTFNFLKEALERHPLLAESVGCKTTTPCDLQPDDQLQWFFSDRYLLGPLGLSGGQTVHVDGSFNIMGF